MEGHNANREIGFIQALSPLGGVSGWIRNDLREGKFVDFSKKICSKLRFALIKQQVTQ